MGRVIDHFHEMFFQCVVNILKIWLACFALWLSEIREGTIKEDLRDKNLDCLQTGLNGSLCFLWGRKEAKGCKKQKGMNFCLKREAV